eukprot:snap_masked-scaffold_42-processed-gene-2.3-mRNA-1 protein AED:1.00 eAED:1.00 QI:0/0/0/0/1/1/2/0/463
MLNINCTKDEDCPSLLVCYEDVPWLDEPSECQCEHWHGWTGTNCTEFGVGAKFLIASTSIQLILATLLRKKVRSCGNVVLVTLFTFFALISFIIWRAVVLTIVLTPEDLTTFGTQNFEEDARYHIYAITFERVSIGITMFWSIFGVIQLAVSWIQTGLAVFQLRNKYFQKFQELKRFYRGLKVVWIITVVPVWFFSSAAVVFVSAGFLFILVLSFLVGFYLLNNVLKQQIKFHSTHEPFMSSTKSTTKIQTHTRFSSTEQKEGRTTEISVVKKVVKEEVPESSFPDLRKTSNSRPKSKLSKLGTARSKFLSTALTRVEFNGDKEKFEAMRRSIRFTTICLFVGCVVLYGCGIAYALMSFLNGGWKYYSPEKQISPVMATNEGIPLGILIAYFGVVQYLWVEITRFLKPYRSEIEDSHGSVNIISNTLQKSENNTLMKPLSVDSDKESSINSRPRAVSLDSHSL